MRYTTRVLLTIFALLAGVNFALAADYYVSSNGNDSNPGTKSAPWKTIAKANATLQPGDIVYMRGAKSVPVSGSQLLDDGTGIYRDPIIPVRSGAPGRYITYSGYPGEAPLLTDVPKGVAINLDNRSYIRINGIYVDGLKPYPDSNINRWVSLEHATYNIVENSDFRNSDGYSAIKIGDGSQYNQILNNRMEVAGTPPSPPDPQWGDMILVTAGAERNLIEGNTIRRGGHNLLNCFGSFNVIRNNIFDSDWGDGLGYRNLELRGSTVGQGYNLFDGNTVMHTLDASDHSAPSMKVEGTNQIVRHNVIIDNSQEAIRSAERLKNGSQDTLSYSERIYNNVIYGNGGPGWVLREDGGRVPVDKNVFKNNIVYNNRLAPESSNYDNDITIWINKLGGSPLASNQFIANAIFSPKAGGGSVYADGIGANTLQWYESHYPANFAKNLVISPAFAVAVLKRADDFQLSADSPLIDRGDFLTKTTSSGTGTTIPVKDAGYFSDGFGIVDGDQIQVGSNAPVKIAKVDYGKNLLTVASAITWTKGEGVSLPYFGSAPDIGAHEYGSSEAPPKAPTGLLLKVSP